MRKCLRCSRIFLLTNPAYWDNFLSASNQERGENTMTRAAYDYVAIDENRVMVTSGGVARFANQWPCSGMRFDADIAVEFEFTQTGDLVDINWYDLSDDCTIDISEPAGVNGEALLALSQDAQRWLDSADFYCGGSR